MFALVIQKFFMFMRASNYKFASLIIITELKFWAFLLCLLQSSSFTNEIILFSCFFSLLLIFFSGLRLLFKCFSLKFKQRLLFFCFISFLALSPYLFFYFLPLFFIRITLSFFLASFFLIFIGFIWIASSNNKNNNYSVLFKKFFPFFTFFLFLISLSYWAFFLNLLSFYLVFLLYNYKFIIIFFKEDWTPLILKSSIIFNFFRLFLPFPLISDIFLLSDAILVLLGSELLSLLRLQSLGTSSKYLLASDFKNNYFSRSFIKPRGFFTFNKSSTEDLLDKRLPFLVNEFMRPNEKGYPTDSLKAALEEFPLTKYPLLSSFFKTNNFYSSREFLHLMFLQVAFPDKLVVPSSLMFPLENLPVLNPRSIERFSIYDDESVLLNHYLFNKRLKSSFIYFFQNNWFFVDPLFFLENQQFLELDELREKFESSANIKILNDCSLESSIWVHNYAMLKKVALFPAQDFIILKPITFDFIATVQAKSSSSEEFLSLTEGSTVSKTDFISVIQAQDSCIKFLSVSPNKKITLIEESSFLDFQAKVQTTLVKKNLAQSITSLEPFLADKEATYRARFNVAEALVLRKPKLPSVKF